MSHFTTQKTLKQEILTDKLQLMIGENNTLGSTSTYGKALNAKTDTYANYCLEYLNYERFST